MDEAQADVWLRLVWQWGRGVWLVGLFSMGGGLGYTSGILIGTDQRNLRI